MTPTPPPDDLDRRLSAYFRRELPDPFPACRALAAAEPSSLARPRRSFADSAGRSRLVLAASVATLFGIGLSVSSGGRGRPSVKAPPSPGTNLLRDSTANGSELLKHTQK